jgi:hypothetical protein
MFEHVLSALLALNSNKLRAALTMLGVVIGVLAVTLLVGVGDGARAYLDRTLSSLGTNLLNVVPGGRRRAGASVRRPRRASRGRSPWTTCAPSSARPRSCGACRRW